ncbi:CCAAT/enhancer-binding protein homolog 2 [Drosophila tropicalis]|uniref:CCAAT/enhancer-binding protein homolog 2 n=1 Tax=Drosophila tropicalis TaxID=46794 RepID=UPI0035ABC8D3
MPAKRRTAAGGDGSNNRASTSTDTGGDMPMSPQTDDPAYKLKRKKNNEAVQRTREKTKKTAEERKMRIEKLKEENTQLKAKIQQEKTHINTLRELIIKGEKDENQNRIIQEILGRPESDDDDD